jgi:presenilin-like A22 family membrane protease
MNHQAVKNDLIYLGAIILCTIFILALLKINENSFFSLITSILRSIK